MERQPDNLPIEEEVVSEPVGSGDDARVIAQENTGGRNMEGSGEWPSPDTPPAPEARGSDPADRAEIEAERASGATTEEPISTRGPGDPNPLRSRDGHPTGDER